MATHPIAAGAGAGTGTAQRDDPGGRIRTAVGARSGLVGNPSDLFGGKVISLLFDAFSAGVTRYESARVTVVPNARGRAGVHHPRHPAHPRRRRDHPRLAAPLPARRLRCPLSQAARRPRPVPAAVAGRCRAAGSHQSRALHMVSATGDPKRPRFRSTPRRPPPAAVHRAPSVEPRGAYDQGLPTERSRATAYRAIRAEITRLVQESKLLPVLIVDETQFMRNDVLDDLRLLTLCRPTEYAAWWSTSGYCVCSSRCNGGERAARVGIVMAS